MDIKLEVLCWAAVIRLLMFVAKKVAMLAIHSGSDYSEGVLNEYHTVEQLADQALRGLGKMGGQHGK
jgi:hypothetical protein